MCVLMMSTYRCFEVTLNELCFSCESCTTTFSIGCVGMMWLFNLCMLLCGIENDIFLKLFFLFEYFVMLFSDVTKFKCFSSTCVVAFLKFFFVLYFIMKNFLFLNLKWLFIMYCLCVSGMKYFLYVFWISFFVVFGKSFIFISYVLFRYVCFSFVCF